MNNNNNNEAVAAFEINYNKSAEKPYSIRCVLIEQGKVQMLKCATKIPAEKPAKGLRNFLERNWENHNKIIRFYNNPENMNVKITKYCEIRPRAELENLVEHYRMRGKPKEIINNNNEFEEIIKESHKKIDDMKQIIKELSQKIKEIEQ